MYAELHSVAVTTDASGDATAYIPGLKGRIINVIYVKTDFANGVDFTITTEESLLDVWVEENVNASKTIAPRQPTHDKAGAASLYAGAGEPVEDHIVMAEERLKIAVAQGGDTKTGTFKIIVA